MKLSKTELSIWLGILAVTGILFLVYFGTVKKGDFVQVKVDGKVVFTRSLSDNGTYPIKGIGENILVIKDGVAWIKEADCPDKLCVKQGKVKNVGQSLICLPNKVVVEVISDSEDSQAVDAVVK